MDKDSNPTPGAYLQGSTNNNKSRFWWCIHDLHKIVQINNAKIESNKTYDLNKKIMLFCFVIIKLKVLIIVSNLNKEYCYFTMREYQIVYYNR